MLLVRHIYNARLAAKRPVISFEFFPPKTDEGDRTLLEKTIPALMPLKPDFCSVTYGAGGGTRDKTLMIVDRIQREHGLNNGDASDLRQCDEGRNRQCRQPEAQRYGRPKYSGASCSGDPPGGNGAMKFQKTGRRV